MSFKEFIYAYQQKTLEQDVAWRAYDIPAFVRPKHAKLALRKLGFSYAGELAVPHLAALHGLSMEVDVRTLLGAWWVWSEISAGRRLRVPLRSLGSAGAEKGV